MLFFLGLLSIKLRNHLINQRLIQDSIFLLGLKAKTKEKIVIKFLIMISLDLNKVVWSSPIALEVYPYEQDQKWIVKRVLVKTTGELVQSFEQVVLSFRLHHENILPLIGYFIETNFKPHSIYLKYPKMKESLEDYTEKNLPFEEKKTIRWIYQLILAVEYMHEHGITHRDIKPANILLDSEDQIKLVDFGLSMYLGDEDGKIISEKGIVGTSQFMAPEVKNGDPQINWYKADVWSLGLVLLELSFISTKLILKIG